MQKTGVDHPAIFARRAPAPRLGFVLFVQRCSGDPELTLTLTFTPALKDAVVTQGCSATCGARPLRRAVRQQAGSRVKLALARNLRTVVPGAPSSSPRRCGRSCGYARR